MANIFKKIGSALLGLPKKILGHARVRGTELFTPVLGALKDTFSKAAGAAGAAGLGKLLLGTLGGVPGQLALLVGPSALRFATAGVKALGGASRDLLPLADLFRDTLHQTKQADLHAAAKHNATRLLQYGQAQKYRAGH